jgi:hypothetical protein
MITFTTPVSVVNNIPNLRKVKVLEVIDNYRASPPNLRIGLQILGSGSVPYGDLLWIYAYDAQASGVLAVNSVSATVLDQLVVVERSLAGTPYTTLAGIWHANTNAGGTRDLRLKAVEAALISNGLIDAALTGAQS